MRTYTARPAGKKYQPIKTRLAKGYAMSALKLKRGCMDKIENYLKGLAMGIGITFALVAIMCLGFWAGVYG